MTRSIKTHILAVAASAFTMAAATGFGLELIATAHAAEAGQQKSIAAPYAPLIATIVVTAERIGPETVTVTAERYRPAFETKDRVLVVDAGPFDAPELDAALAYAESGETRTATADDLVF